MTAVLSGTITSAWTAVQLKRNLTRVLSPTVARDVLQGLDRESVGSARIGQMLVRDPFITAKVLAMANMIRGRNRPVILSLDRAVQVLGTRNVRTLILSVMLTGPLLSLDPNIPRRRDLWRWVLACGVAGSRVGELTRVGGRADGSDFDGTGDAAAGLVMGLGPLILYAGLSQEYSTVLGSTIRPLDLARREQKALDVSHHQVSIWALNSLYCAEELGSLAAALADERDNPLRLRARVIEVLGARIAGYESAKAEAWLLDAMPRMGIDPGQVLGENLDPLRSRLRELAQAMDVELGDWFQQEEERQATLLAAGAAMEGLLVDTLSLSESIGEGLANEAAQAIAVVAAERGIDVDPLTGLLNRRGWDRRRAELAPQGARRLGLIMADIDAFKEINDSQGHICGDQVLKRVAGAMTGASPAPLMLARFGGDELAAVYPAQNAAELTATAAGIAALLRQSGDGGSHRQATISMGGIVTTARRLSGEWESVYAEADSLLYEAKRRGRDQAVIAADAPKTRHD